MKNTALAAIRMYQRYLSPIKGFSCAYRVHAGGESCFAYGYQVIDRYGIRTGIALLRRRLDACAHLHRQHASIKPEHRAGLASKAKFQAGFCDVPCDGCDVETAGCDGVDIAGSACDIFSNCGSCDFGSWGGSRKKGNEKWVKIGPYSNLIAPGKPTRRSGSNAVTHAS